MATDIREICTLTDEDLDDRIETLGKRLFASAKRRETLPNGLAVYFEDTWEMQNRLDEFVEFERVCCSGIGWSVDRVSDGLRLEIIGVDPGSPTFARIGLEPADASEETAKTFWPRLLRSAGLGSLGALFVCCVLPLGIVALVGATPLLLLDNPWLIGASALGLSGFLWHREGRRSARPTRSENASGCGC